MQVGRRDVRFDDVVEGGTGDMGNTPIGVRAVFEQPPNGNGIDALARNEENGEPAPAQSVDVGAVADEEVHHRDTSFMSRAHQRRAAALMDVGALVDQPLRDGKARWTGGGRGRGTRRPRRGDSLAQAAVETGVRVQEGFDAIEIVGGDGRLELADLFERLNLLLQLGPACEAVLPGNLKLGVGKRRRLARSEQVLGLILEMPQVGMLGKLVRRSLWSARHGNLLSVWRPVSAVRAERRFASRSDSQVGFYPFRGPDASCTQIGILPRARLGVKPATGGRDL